MVLNDCCDLIDDKMRKNVVLSGSEVSLDFFDSVLFDNAEIVISNELMSMVEASYNFLANFSADKLIYGITTGLGPMAQYRVTDEDRRQLQYNLIRSHCSGIGNKMSPIYVKSAMICRLLTILNAKSGIHPECASLLLDFINKDITPVIYEHGSVGASGDLVQLSHLALSLIGEGEVLYKGSVVPTSKAMEAEGLQPISIYIREGLSLINGTSVMTGISIVNLLRAKRLFSWGVMSSAIINEIVRSYSDSYSIELNSAKRHIGQNMVAKSMREILEGSKLTKERKSHLYNREVKEVVIKEKVQEYYSIRCVPQILGPIYDTIANVEKIVLDEVNSVSDNPIVDLENENVFHGGNFHGDYISLEMDKLKIVVTRLAMTAERQLNYLLNPKLNETFTPFVNLGVLGLNLGMQGVQFTATSTTAECQTLSFPNYVHSIPNNNDNQDIVSMGTNSALITGKVIENTFEVLAVYYMALSQGIDNIGVQAQMSTQTSDVYTKIRNIVPVFVEDTTKYKELAKVKEYLMSNDVKTIY